MPLFTGCNACNPSALQGVYRHTKSTFMQYENGQIGISSFIFKKTTISGLFAQITFGQTSLKMPQPDSL